MVTTKKAGRLVGSDNLKPKKENKAKEGPKRLLSAYMLFCNDKREEAKGDGFKGKHLMTELARRWRDLDEKAKQPYVTANEEAKAQAAEQGKEQTKTRARTKSPGKDKASRSLSPPKGKAKAMDETMAEEEKPKRGRKKCGGC